MQRAIDNRFDGYEPGGQAMEPLLLKAGDVGKLLGLG
jgi:hypothetical protein